jgi:hypothetical protein
MIKRRIPIRLRRYIKSKRSLFYHFNSSLERFNNPIWLIGSSRSGTTWFSSLINYHKRFRLLFEPFHPTENGDKSDLLHPFQYIREDGDDDRISSLATEIFNGRFTHQRADRGNIRLFYDGLVIKDIYANLFAAWACKKFGLRNVILLIRNPFSVAVSKTEHRSWFEGTDNLDFLNQKNLIEDHLYPFQGLIQKIKEFDDFTINQILIWSVINYIPLKQFKPGQLQVVYYEDLFEDPVSVLRNVYANFFPEIPKQEILPEEDLISSPSQYSSKSRDQLNSEYFQERWKVKLTKQQIEAGFEILYSFGLDTIYGRGLSPDPSVAQKLLSQ